MFLFSGHQIQLPRTIAGRFTFATLMFGITAFVLGAAALVLYVLTLWGVSQIRSTTLPQLENVWAWQGQLDGLRQFSDQLGANADSRELQQLQDEMEAQSAACAALLEQPHFQALAEAAGTGLSTGQALFCRELSTNMVQRLELTRSLALGQERIEALATKVISLLTPYLGSRSAQARVQQWIWIIEGQLRGGPAHGLEGGQQGDERLVLDLLRGIPEPVQSTTREMVFGPQGLFELGEEQQMQAERLHALLQAFEGLSTQIQEVLQATMQTALQRLASNQGLAWRNALWLAVVLTVVFLGALGVIGGMYRVAQHDVVQRLHAIRNNLLDAAANPNQAQGLNWPNLRNDELDVMATALADLLRIMHQAMDAAAQANRAKSVFLAQMSHEIRTPMNAIISFSDMLLSAESDPVRREQLQSIADAARHLLSIINDILELAKVEASKLTLKESCFDLRSMLHSVTKMMQGAARNKAVRLETDFQPSLPGWICCDEIRLRQVLMNLLSNSVKFTESGFIRVCAQAVENEDNPGIGQAKTESSTSPIDGAPEPTWSASQSGHPQTLSDASEDMGNGTEQSGASGPVQSELHLSLRFSVQDTGLGIPKTHQEHIFTNFYQVDQTATRRFGGTGLGLAITKNLVQLMGGDISVQSHPGQGSVFSFTIRARLPRPEEQPAAAEVVYQPVRKERNLHILLVEDNPVNVKIGQAVLKRLGHSVTVAGNGLEALKVLTRETVDLIFMDLEMPGMDGLECSRRIRAGEAGFQATDICIIAMTAHAFDEIRERCLTAGMNDFLTKPVAGRKLEEVIARHTQSE